LGSWLKTCGPTQLLFLYFSEIRYHHSPDEFSEAHPGFPAKKLLGLGCITQQLEDLGRAEVAWIDCHTNGSCFLVDSFFLDLFSLPNNR
jgi:hypothetical protein